MDKRITYSQNFLINKALVSELIEKSSITDKDIVNSVVFPKLGKYSKEFRIIKENR